MKLSENGQHLLGEKHQRYIFSISFGTAENVDVFRMALVDNDSLSDEL